MTPVSLVIVATLVAGFAVGMAPQDGTCGCEASRDSSCPAARAQQARQLPPSVDEAAIALPLRFDARVNIPKGTATLGTATPHFVVDAEGPPYNFSVQRDFFMDKYEVTNRRFARFVFEATYTTEAEKFGWSFVHELAIPSETLQTITQSVQGAEWWLPVQDAYWFSPEGPLTSISGRLDHPVVHVSHRDAAAFCKWNGGRLPTEGEWEYAARGGKRMRMYAWGNMLLTNNNKHRANIWQGAFPFNNTVDDGYMWTSPVGAFEEQNAFGLHDVAGNVWEWTSTAWCPQSPGSELHNPVRVPPECARISQAARRAQATDAGEVDVVKKGGSFLCQINSSFRYRVAARHKNTANSSAYNLGFRCVYDAAK
jgi:sulfatase modifying factor 1